MTREEAIQWIQLDIDMAKFDPTTGEDAYLNDDAKNVIEAQEMAISALKALPNLQQSCNELATDTISRQAAIDAISRLAIDRFTLQDTYKAYIDALKGADALIRQLPYVQPERKTGQWIPCSERLPDKEGNYLMTAQPTYNHTKDIRIAHWSGRWVGYVKSEILAWMPLPEPYKEGEQDG